MLKLFENVKGAVVVCFEPQYVIVNTAEPQTLYS